MELKKQVKMGLKQTGKGQRAACNGTKKFEEKSEEPQRRRVSPKESEDVPTERTGSERFWHLSEWNFYPGLKMECRAALRN